MNIYPRWWRVHFLLAEFCLSIVIAAIVVWLMTRDSGVQHLDKLLQPNRATVYGTIATIFGSLLGFVITAISIVLGFASHERLTIVKESKHYSQLWKVFMSATRWLGAATIIALIGLVFDTSAQPYHMIMAVCLWMSILAVFRIARCLWVLERIIEVVTR